MITVVVLIALAAGAALGAGASALFVARGHAVGWLVVSYREPDRVWQSAPIRSIGAGNLAGSGVSGLAAGDREAARSGLDATGAAWTIEARPDAGPRQLAARYDGGEWSR